MHTKNNEQRNLYKQKKANKHEQNRRIGRFLSYAKDSFRCKDSDGIVVLDFHDILKSVNAGPTKFCVYRTKNWNNFFLHRKNYSKMRINWLKFKWNFVSLIAIWQIWHDKQSKCHDYWGEKSEVKECFFSLLLSIC